MRVFILGLLVATAVANINLRKLTGKPCSNGDIRYAVGCDNQYLHCINNQEYVMACASGLYFDPVLDRCEYKSDNTICQSEQVDSEKRVPAVKPQCASEGQLIAVSSCNENYYHCAHGQANMRKCPYNQVFFPATNSCDFKTKCIQARSQKISGELNDSAVNNEDEAVAAESSKPDENDAECEVRRAEKIGAERCSTSIYTCANGHLFQQSCAYGLIFNLDRNLCDFPDSVPGCGSKLNLTSEEFSCAGKEDGFYTLGQCAKTFMACTNGDKRSIDCPSELVFDARISACDYPLSCSGERKSDGLPELHEHADLPNNETIDEHASFDCSMKSDGFYYIRACTENFVECCDNATFVRTCPEELVYNPAKKSCDLKKSCNESSAHPEEVPEPIQPVNSTTEFTCTDRTDGLYPSDLCSGTYYSCWNNELSVSECPANLTFNAYKGLCDHQAAQEDCGAGAQLEEQLDPYCERLADGIYGVGCNSYYYRCESFETIKLNCPQGLMFNTETQSCQHSSFVAACGGALPENVISTTTEKPQDTHQAPPSEPVQPPTLPIFSCEGKDDGIYALPYCTPEYVQCVRGKALITRCLFGLFFNAENGNCDYESNVAQCKEEKASATGKTCTEDGYFSSGCSKHYYFCKNNQSIQMTCPANLKFCMKNQLCDYPEAVEECKLKQNAKHEPKPQKEHAAQFCRLKGFGTFAHSKCSSNYISCGVVPAIASCPEPLVFDSSSGICNYKSSTVECQ